MVNSAAITECTTSSSEVFSPKINHWAEGVLLAIDADNSKLILRGAKRPYASEYAKMLKKIFEQTKELTQANRESRASAIRVEWADALAQANGPSAEADADLTFHLPQKNTKLVLVDEIPFSGHHSKFMMHDKRPESLTDRECRNIDALKDLRVGQTIMVGYESGLLRNDAYVVIKANSSLN